VQPLSLRTPKRDQPNTARSSYVDTASGSESARLSLKPLICEDAGDLYGPESPVRIRNTFLDSPLERSPSLERFFEERKVRSCPASGPHSRQGSNSSLPQLPVSEEEGNDVVAATLSDSNSTLVTPRAGSASVQRLPALARRGDHNSDVLAAAAVQLAKDFETKMSWADEVRQDCLQLVAAELLPVQPGVGADDSSGESSTTAGNQWCSRPTSETSGSGAISLTKPQVAGSATSIGAGTGGVAAAFADASSRQAAINVSELPSKGSALHPWGGCKPCAFVFEAGCANGTECQFCHLCEPGEKRRRKKERRRLTKDNHQASQA